MIDLCGIRHGRSNIKQLDEDEIIQQDKRKSTDTASVSVKVNTKNPMKRLDLSSGNRMFFPKNNEGK